MNNSYEEQISYLKTRYNLLIYDDEKAIEILKSVGLYRLLGYNTNVTSFNTLTNLYYFDSKLRNCLIYMLEQIEIQLKEQISHLIFTKYGNYGYLENSNFLNKVNLQGTKIHEIILEKLNKEIERNAKYKNLKNDSALYVWEALDLFTFGNLIALYNILMYEYKKTIASVYKTKTWYLKSWLLALVEIRNICAHYGRIYNIVLNQAPYLYKEYLKYRKKQNMLFPILLIVKRMLNSNYLWEDFVNKLLYIIKEYEVEEYLINMGFPNEWEEVIKNNP